MNKKEMKAHYEAKTLGEVRGIYTERDRVLNNMKGIIKDYSQKIIDLDPESKVYVNRLKDYADHVKSYSRDIAEEIAFLEILKPILDKKEAEGVNEAEYTKYLEENKVNTDLLLLKVKEMEKLAQETWDKKKISEDTIRNIHIIMYKELIIMLKDSIGNITEIRNLEYNANRGMDGTIAGEKGLTQINTILAGGYNIQKLHYRTLIQKWGN